jgi:hypothetical protein
VILLDRIAVPFLVFLRSLHTVFHKPLFFAQVLVFSGSNRKQTKTLAHLILTKMWRRYIYVYLLMEKQAQRGYIKFQDNGTSKWWDQDFNPGR